MDGGYNSRLSLHEEMEFPVDYWQRILVLRREANLIEIERSENKT